MAEESRVLRFQLQVLWRVCARFVVQHFSLLDDSAADLALCSHLAFWVGNDPARIDALFRQSGLYRKKWEREDYRQRTIAKALGDCKRHWRPKAERSEPALARTSQTALVWQPAHLSQQVNAERLVQILDGNARFNINRGQWCWFDARCFADAGVGLYMLVADGEPGAEVYTAATKRDQARLAHGEAIRMVKASKSLKKVVGISKDNMYVEKTQSRYVALGGDADSTNGLRIQPRKFASI